MIDPQELRKSFERQGKSSVKAFIEASKRANGSLSDDVLEAIRWLDEVENKEYLEAEAKRDAREIETLKIVELRLNLTQHLH